MDRASDSGSEGWGFESLPVYHEKAAFASANAAFSSEVCLAAREVCCASEVAFSSEVPAGVGGTLCFTSCEARYFTMPQA